MKYLKKFSGEEEYQEYLNNPEELDTPHVGLIDNETKKLRYQPTCKFGYTIYIQEPQVIDVIPSSFFDLGDGKLSEDLFYNNSNPTLTLNFSGSDGGTGEDDYFIELPGFRYWVEEQRTEELSYYLFNENLFLNYGISTQALPSFLGFFPSFDSQVDSLGVMELNPMILFYDIRMNYDGEDVADYDVWGYSLGDAAVNQWLVDNNAEGDDEYMNEHYSELQNIYYSPIKLAVQNYLSSHTLAQIAAPITVIDGKGNEQEFPKVSPYVISYLGMTQRLHPDWTWSQVVSQCWEMPAPKSLYWTFDTFFADFNENSNFSAYTTSLLLTPNETDETYLTSFRYLINLNGSPNLYQYIETQLNNQYTNPDTGELTITQEELWDLIEPAVNSYIQEHFSTSDTLEERKSNVVRVLCEICGAEYVRPTNSPIKTVLIDGEEIEIKTELTVSSIGTNYGNALYYFEPGIHEITLVTSSFIKDGNYFSGLGNNFGILGIKYPHTWNTVDVNELNSINFFIKEWAINNMEIPPSRVEYGENIENIIQGGEGSIFGKDIDLVIKDKKYKIDHDHQLVLKGGRLELVYGSSSLTSLPRSTDANFIITSISPTAFPNCKIEVDSYEVPEGITKLETGSLHHICLKDGFVLVLPSTITSLEPGIFHPDSSSNGAIIFNSDTPPSGFADFLGESGKLFYVVQNSWQEDNYSIALGNNHPNITLTTDANEAIMALRYLVFDILSPGTITIGYDGPAPTDSGYYLSYKFNNGDWVKLTGTDIINLSLEVEEGDSIIWEGNALRGYLYSGSSNFRRSKFNITSEFEIHGSLNSLMYDQSGEKLTEVPKGGFYELFKDCTGLISAKNLTLPKSLNSGGYNFYRMFSGCTSLVEAPEISVDIAETYAFYYMFYNCTSLTSSPNISTTTLKSNSCSYMFSNCTGLVDAGSINVSDTIEGACSYMFSGCTNLRTTPEIIANTVASSAFQNKYMFSGCSSLTTVSPITITNAEGSALYGLFNGFINLTDVGDITITNAGERSLSYMFSNCTSLVSSPKLSITNLASNCCSYMFRGCTSLTTTPDLPATTLADYCYQYMFQGCTSLTTEPELPATTLANGCYRSMFQNCTSLTAAPILPATTLANYCYNYMFGGCTSLMTAPSLPATTLAQSCYSGMFSGCTSLTTAPELPATTLASSCYSSMFNGCTSLETAPELPAMILENYCYQYMFQNCTSLTEAPDLPATALASGCYSGMFKGCTALTSAPTLSATTLAKKCYGGYVEYYPGDASTMGMFEDCTSLTTAPILSATSLAEQCYAAMFKGCTSLTTAPSLPATTLASRCYSGMFENCDSLTTLPTLPATSLVYGCYMNMFKGCTNLVSVPTNYLPVTTLASYCYSGMFQDCTSLTQAPSLPATTLSDYCYGSSFFSGNSAEGMFKGCTSLTTAPELPAMTLQIGCYMGMFEGCTSLASAPTLSATTLTNSCYNSMFKDCTSLTTAPVLPATTLQQSCYQYMFSGCTNLSYIKMLATSISVSKCLTDWVYGIAENGTFVMNSEATWYNVGNSGIPSRWEIQFDGNSTTAEDYISEIKSNYFYTEAIESGTFTLTIPSSVNTTYITSVSYSLDGGTSWTTINNDSSTVTITTPTIQAGGKVFWKGKGSRFSISTLNTASILSSTGQFNVGGCIMSLLAEDENFIEINTINQYAFFYFFYNCANLVSAGNLKFPTVVANYCYNYMFQRCTSLTTAPSILPATTLANSCYSDMFSGCTALTTAPILPATTLANYCYNYMFQNCTSLTSAPELPATTLAQSCYSYMFYKCSNLTTAPILPATTLVSYCYSYMFQNCTNLSYVKALFTTTPSSSYTYNWLSGVKSSGTFVKHTNATWTTTGANGVPSGWTIERASE